MKKTAVCALCLCLLSCFAVSVHADGAESTDNHPSIHLSVPDKHTLSINTTGGATIMVNGQSGTSFEMDRLSVPDIKIKAADGMIIESIFINGEDVTSNFSDGNLLLPPVYEDMIIDIVSKQAEVTVTTSTAVTTYSSAASSTTVADTTVNSALNIVKPVGSAKTGDTFPLGALILTLLSCTAAAVCMHSRE